jgi:hypothetical protein
MNRLMSRWPPVPRRLPLRLRRPPFVTGSPRRQEAAPAHQVSPPPPMPLNAASVMPGYASRQVSPGVRAFHYIYFPFFSDVSRRYLLFSFPSLPDISMELH